MKAREQKKPIRKLIDDQNVPVPLVWSNFISLDENKGDLARFLSLQQPYELVTLNRRRILRCYRCDINKER